jgi:hypothetical protein
VLPGRRDIQHDDTQHNNIQHNDIQHNDIQQNDLQHNDIQHKGLICDTEHKGAHSLFIEGSHMTKNMASGCHFVECHYAECLSAIAGSHSYKTTNKLERLFRERIFSLV